MADQTKQKAVYEFLRQQAATGATFTADDINRKMGWTDRPAATYIAQHYRAYLESAGTGVFRVSREFRRVTWDEFRELVDQARQPLASYARSTYSAVVVYDVLMPLTREDKLRRALDHLFYRDTLVRRIREADLEVFAQAIPRSAGEGDVAYVARILEFAAKRIRGFSISHVSGRSRTDSVLSLAKATDHVARDEPYLIDETTAVVRFIIPCLSSKIVHGLEFRFEDAKPALDPDVGTEVQQIRLVFFELFVEALVPSIRGEQLIWILETAPAGQRLYELDLARPTDGGVGAADGMDERDDGADG